MENSRLEFEELTRGRVDALQPLAHIFVRAHPRLPFKENYWAFFWEWLAETITNPDALCLTAVLDGQPLGFILAHIKDNVPILSPGQVGHVNILVVDPKNRLNGIGTSLWNAVREWFLSKGVCHFELYVEYGNKISGPFWQKRGFETLVELRTRVQSE